MKILSTILAAAILVTAFPAVATATKGNDDNVWLCHRTASDSNPYVLIRVDPASLDAHLNNLPGHPQKHGRDDFMPSPWQIENRTCGDPPTSPQGDVTATGFVCSDPRIIMTIRSITFETVTPMLRFVSAKTFAVVKVPIRVRAGATKTIKRWVAGRTTAWLQYDGARIWSTRIDRSTNTGPCPRLFTIA